MNADERKMNADKTKAVGCAAMLVVAVSCGRRLENVSCRVFPDGEAAVCELASDGEVRVPRQLLAHAEFGPEGISAILVGEKIYFVNRAGKTAPALKFDNGPDYFVEGLARTVKGGKVGFVNTALETVVAPVWDFAFPFSNGVALVCSGCTAAGGEHQSMKGGKWGYIDKGGKVVVPATGGR
jgi:hypothetical protein